MTIEDMARDLVYYIEHKLHHSLGLDETDPIKISAFCAVHTLEFLAARAKDTSTSEGATLAIEEDMIAKAIEKEFLRDENPNSKTI